MCLLQFLGSSMTAGLCSSGSKRYGVGTTSEPFLRSSPFFLQQGILCTIPCWSPPLGMQASASELN